MDFNALALAESTSGGNFLEGLKNLSISKMSAIFWACARQCDDKLTLTGSPEISATRKWDEIADAVKEGMGRGE